MIIFFCGAVCFFDFLLKIICFSEFTLFVFLLFYDLL